ncbi:MAG: hypothetical protein H0T57_12575 [Rubrobacter sp.]|nr:hypothetical protein [Rubrobacter sp.]
MLGFINFKYLAGKQGIHAVGSLLGLEEPWEQISTQLARDRAGLEKLIEDTTKRRNDIVHRADRSQSDPGGDAQEIGYAWSKQAVDTISHVCFALDELVTIRMVKLKEAAERAEGT